MNTLGWILIALLAYKAIAKITSALDLRSTLNTACITELDDAYRQGYRDALNTIGVAGPPPGDKATFTIDVGHMN